MSKTVLFTQTISDLAQCTEHLRTSPASWETGEQVVIAENELFGASKSIEDAAIKISQIHPRTVHVIIPFELYWFFIAKF